MWFHGEALLPGIPLALCTTILAGLRKVSILTYVRTSCAGAAG